MSKRLEGRVAVITGAGSGIGYATAKRLASEGAKVVVADTNEITIKNAIVFILLPPYHFDLLVMLRQIKTLKSTKDFVLNKQHIRQVRDMPRQLKCKKRISLL